MWPFKKRSSAHSTSADQSQQVEAARLEKAALKEAVDRLFLLSTSQWYDEMEGKVSLTPHNRFVTTSSSGWSILLVREDRADSLQGEQLKDTYELFINGRPVGSYFECRYEGGGKLIGGEAYIHDLYLHIMRGQEEHQNNSREWRASREQIALRHSKGSLD